MVKYEIVKVTAEKEYNKNFEYFEGVTLEQDRVAEEIILSFDVMEEAKAKLSEFRSSVTKTNTIPPGHSIVEYFIVEREYKDEADDEGVVLGIWGTSTI